ncbi:MAG: 2-C-methyl-D-erythritol 4-phosphate cytidylyltransferase [Clostridia bacterium]|nr:2-C-methyl-D-erythritol 4-phosphate cytidylyltransferase [Clostridia bacterium]
MKKTDKNIIMITAGGFGQRFGTDVPKQYIQLNGRPVISYVIEACKKSKAADAILVVADPAYHAALQETYGVDTAVSGPELNITKRNGFDYIREHSSCEKLVVAEAVRPTLEPDVLDETFRLLDEYDAVACARKITDSLGHYGEWVVNRANYYTLNPPEGFRFALLDKYFRPDSVYTESIQQLPDTSRVYLNFDVPYFDKITYPEDLVKAEAIMQWKEAHEK